MNDVMVDGEIDAQIEQLITDLQDYDVFPFYLRLCMARKAMSQFH